MPHRIHARKWRRIDRCLGKKDNLADGFLLYLEGAVPVLILPYHLVLNIEIDI